MPKRVQRQVLRTHKTPEILTSYSHAKAYAAMPNPEPESKLKDPTEEPNDDWTFIGHKPIMPND